MPRAGPLPLLARQMLLCLRIYLDTAFFNDLQNKFGGCTDSNACKFSRDLRAGRAGNRTAPWQTGRKRKASAQIQQTTAASAGGISALMLATAGCSVTQEREASSPTEWAERHRSERDRVWPLVGLALRWQPSISVGTLSDRQGLAHCLRVCPDTLGRITKFSKHEPN